MFRFFVLAAALAAGVYGSELQSANITEDANTDLPASVGLSPRNPSSNANEEVSARFFWKKKPKSHVTGHGGGYGYSYSGSGGASWATYCNSCHSSYAYQCCQAGYSRCCYNRPPLTGGGKPGYCPQQPYNTYFPNNGRQCTAQCTTDNDCPYDFKCCSLGCSYSCIRPEGTVVTPPKPGVCPILPIPIRETSEDFGGVYVPRNKPLKRAFNVDFEFSYGNGRYCRLDGECPGSEKCCNGVCTYIPGEVYPVRSFG